MSYSRQTAKRRHKSEYQKLREDQCYAKLEKEINTRCKTIFVGAVAKIETTFGALWGSDQIDEDDMTKEQQKWYEAFLDIREQIFDQGNEQLTKLIMERRNCQDQVDYLRNRNEQHK